MRERARFWLTIVTCVAVTGLLWAILGVLIETKDLQVNYFSKYELEITE